VSRWGGFGSGRPSSDLTGTFSLQSHLSGQSCERRGDRYEARARERTRWHVERCLTSRARTRLGRQCLSNHHTKEVSNGTDSFDFDHKTKHGRRAGADRRPSGLAGADNAYAQAKQTMPEKSLYERLGGVFAIAAVVDHFSDAVVKNPIVGQKSKNPQLREWHTKSLGRLPGLKFMRTLWVCNVSGGPFQFAATKPGTTPLGLEEAHRDLRISPAEFDEVAAELGRTLDFFKVPKPEKVEVLAAFAAHKDEVTAGYVAGAKRG
jgi:hemoglobin